VDRVHYPGTYVAGCYTRWPTTLAGVVVEDESLVNLPNWLPDAAGEQQRLQPGQRDLVVRLHVGDIAWFTPDGTPMAGEHWGEAFARHLPWSPCAACGEPHEGTDRRPTITTPPAKRHRSGVPSRSSGLGHVARDDDR
jgi:hypothetical protein